jgi:hypothetical protein
MVLGLGAAPHRCGPKLTSYSRRVGRLADQQKTFFYWAVTP